MKSSSSGVTRGPVSRTPTTWLPPVGRVRPQVPSAVPDHNRTIRTARTVGRFVWCYHRELLVAAAALTVAHATTAVLPSTAASIALIVLTVAAVVVEVRCGRVRRWLAPGVVRRRWAVGVRSTWLFNLGDQAPRIRRIRRCPAGLRLDIAVPGAVAVADIETNADLLASTLKVKGVRVDVDPYRSRADRIGVTVVHRDPHTIAAPAWPSLTDSGPVSVWDGVPVGVDEDGDPVTLTLAYRNVLVGGEPGSGKSVATSQLVAAAALDPTVDLHLLDAKLLELGAWRGIATSFVGADLPAAVDLAEQLVCVMDTRLAELDAQPGIVRKITPTSGHRVQVVIIDEYGWFTSRRHDRKTVAAFEAAMTDLVARGRAAGIVVILATQKPSSEVIATGLRDLFAYRCALRCTTPQASDTILGQGRAAAGYTAVDIAPATPGVGWLLHETGVPQRIRTHELTDNDLTTLIDRAHHLRDVTPAPTLTAVHPTTDAADDAEAA